MSLRRRLLAAAAVSVLAIATPLLADSTAPQAPATGGWGRFGVQTQWIDTAAKPGDDFDRYVNGKWEDVTQIPPDKTRIGSFITLRDLSEDRLHAILDELPATHPAPGTASARALPMPTFCERWPGKRSASV